MSIIEDTGDAIEVRFTQQLTAINHDHDAILTDLPNTIHLTVQNAIAALAPEFQLRATAATNPSPNVWQLQETQHYKVNTQNAQKPTLVTSDGTVIQAFDLSKKDSTTFLTDLNRGVIPEKAEPFLKASPYLVYPLKQQVTIKKPDRISYTIDVVKTLYLVDELTFFNLCSLQQYQVEAHLTAIASPSQAEAKQVVEDVKLNRIQPSDTRNSDRRMSKRTRTWFMALEAVSRLNEAAASPVLSDLEDLIIQTAIATGYWSVWVSVFQTFLANPKRDHLIASLSQGANFPGTR